MSEFAVPISDINHIGSHFTVLITSFVFVDMETSSDDAGQKPQDHIFRRNFRKSLTQPLVHNYKTAYGLSQKSKGLMQFFGHLWTCQL